MMDKDEMGKVAGKIGHAGQGVKPMTEAKVTASGGQVMGSVNPDPKAQQKILKDKIDNMDNVQLVRYMEQHHKSDVYVVLRDFVTDKRRSEIERDPMLKQRFKQVKKQANDSWKHDHAFCTNYGVDKACSIVYTTLLKMIRVQQDEITNLKEMIGKHHCECNNHQQDRGDKHAGTHKQDK